LTANMQSSKKSSGGVTIITKQIIGLLQFGKSPARYLYVRKRHFCKNHFFFILLACPSFIWWVDNLALLHCGATQEKEFIYK